MSVRLDAYDTWNSHLLDYQRILPFRRLSVEDARVVHDAATHDGQHRGDILDFLFGDFVLIEEIVVEDDKVAKLTDLG